MKVTSSTLYIPTKNDAAVLDAMRALGLFSAPGYALGAWLYEMGFTVEATDEDTFVVDVPRGLGETSTGLGQAVLLILLQHSLDGSHLWLEDLDGGSYQCYWDGKEVQCVTS